MCSFSRICVKNVDFLQLDSVDEQAAQVRRELADRKGFLEEMAIVRFTFATLLMDEY